MPTRHRPNALTPSRPKPGPTARTHTRMPPPAAAEPPPPEDLALPHERDEASGQTSHQPDPVIHQAKRDIDRRLVDTDMRATPGLDAQRREALVSGSDTDVDPAQVPPPPAGPRDVRPGGKQRGG